MDAVQTHFITRRDRVEPNSKRRTSMKSKFTFALATSMLVLTLVANPPKAHAAFDQYLHFPTASSTATSGVSVGTVSYVVSFVASVVLP